MKTRTRNAAILGVLTASAVAALVYAELQGRKRAVVDVLPRNAAMVIEIDLATLRKSAAGRDALELLVLKPLEAKARCAGELLRSLERVGIAIPAGAGFEDDVAIVAMGSWLRAGEVATCAEGVVRDRGGAPSTLKQGTFTLVQDGDGTHGILAVRDGGPLVVGRGPWLSAVVDVADGVAKSLRDDPVHDLARRAKTGAFATLTYALPEELRNDLATKLPKGAQVLAKVPSLIAALRLEDVEGGVLVLEAEAACSGAVCPELQKLAEGAREMLAHDPRATLLGVKDDLEHATITGEAARVVITLRVKVERLQSIWKQLAGDAAVAPTLPSGHPESTAVGPLGSTSASALAPPSASVTTSP
ncbi:MAG: hypothetical protein ABI175_22720 [Polyangiales bacterium]